MSASAAACECNVRDRLFAFYGWCHQHEDIPELINLVKTIARQGRPDRYVVLTGVSTRPPKAEPDTDHETPSMRTRFPVWSHLALCR